MSESVSKNKQKSNAKIGKYLIVAIILIAVVALYKFLPVAQWIELFRLWVDGLGPVGWFVTIIAYALATIAFFPGGILTITAGVIFGLWAFPIVVIGATIGAGGAFLLGRYFFHEKLQRKMEQWPKFKAIDGAIKEEGWKVVGLMRLSPAVPFNLQNWFFGLTSVGFWQYLLTTFIGIMPGTLLYVWIGSLGGAAADNSEASTAKYILLAVGLIATFAVTYLISKKAKQKLDQYKS